jgi:hypothetical protein
MAAVPEILRDGRGEIRRTASDFVVGPDNELIQLWLYLRDRERAGALDPDALTFDVLQRLAIAPRVHLVDVSADNPEAWYFAFYGPRWRLDDHSFHGRRIADAPWPILRTHALGDYARIKRTGECDLLEVEVVDLLKAFRSRYRRLVFPLRASGCQITHLVVASLRLVDGCAHGLDERRDLMLDRPHQGLASLRRKETVDHPHVARPTV